MKNINQNRWLLAMMSAIPLLFTMSVSQAQQIPDTAFHLPIRQAAYAPGSGPLVMIDRGHCNFHTREGGFYAFAKLLQEDGYRVQSLSGPIRGPHFPGSCRILVIANALDSSNRQRWILPTPSAFSREEIRTIEQWVRDGGCLLLIADHMPFAGAATDLGRAFGFEFLNGFAFTGQNTWPPSTFSVKNGTLLPSPAVRGLTDKETIDSVATFTGSAFRIPEKATGVLGFTASDYSLQPDTAWRFNARTPSVKLNGYFQGAVMDYGKGRIAVFGEAAMFTAQIANGSMRVGFNSESAPQNGQFILNLIHWLDRIEHYQGIKNKTN